MCNEFGDGGVRKSWLQVSAPYIRRININ
jgi:hypothetical protein